VDGVCVYVSHTGLAIDVDVDEDEVVDVVQMLSD
jgi:heterodisulfide reductase subunit A-like polyferredoxin